MIPKILFLLSLIVSGACVLHSIRADWGDFWSRPMWAFIPSSRFSRFMYFGGTIGGCAWLATVVWGIMHVRWYWLLALFIASRPLTRWFESRFPAGPVVATIAAPLLCTVLWFLK